MNTISLVLTLQKEAILSKEDTLGLITELLTDKEKEKFLSKKEVDFSFTFTASTSSRKNKAPGKSDFEEQDRTKRWSVSPRLTYSFSNQVRGGAFLEIGRTDSKRIGKTSIQEFGLDINISISGR